MCMFRYVCFLMCFVLLCWNVLIFITGREQMCVIFVFGFVCVCDEVFAYSFVYMFFVCEGEGESVCVFMLVCV